MKLEDLSKSIILNKETEKASKKLIKEIKILKKEEKKYFSMIAKEKKKKIKSLKKYRDSEIDEKLYSEGFIRSEFNDGFYELIEQPTEIPYIEIYNEDLAQLENIVFLRDGNRKGLFLEVNKTEEINVEYHHDTTIKKLDYNGNINIRNPSNKNKIRDMELVLNNIDDTHLNSNTIKIQELGKVGQNNIYTQKLHADNNKDLLIIKEFINTFTDADKILNLNDIDIKIQEIREINNKGCINNIKFDSRKLQIEHFKLPINEKTKVTFAIAIYNPHRIPIKNIIVIKEIPHDFTNLQIIDTLWGIAEIEEDQLIWTIDQLPSDMIVVCKFTCDIVILNLKSVKTGPIKVEYRKDCSFFQDSPIQKFIALTDVLYKIEKYKRNGTERLWDYKAIIENNSDFMIKLHNVDLTPIMDKYDKDPLIQPSDIPILPSRSQWHSAKLNIKMRDLNQYKLEVEYSIIPYFKMKTLVQILISDAELLVEMKIQDD